MVVSPGMFSPGVSDGTGVASSSAGETSGEEEAGEASEEGEPGIGITCETEGRAIPACLSAEAAQTTAVRRKTQVSSREIRRAVSILASNFSEEEVPETGSGGEMTFWEKLFSKDIE